MRGKRAKQIRRSILGNDYTHRGLEYTTNDKGMRLCADRRKLYKLAKRRYKCQNKNQQLSKT